jgi:AraC-like DNA-binding protein
MRHVDPPTATSAGVLRPEGLARTTQLQRAEPHPALAHWVENYWTLQWDLPPGVSYDSHTLPHPACNLSVELGQTRPEVGSDHVGVTGVVNGRFEVSVRGRGAVIAAKFRPGGLVALAGGTASDWRDRVVPGRAVLPQRTCELLAPVTLDTGRSDALALLERSIFELSRAAARDPAYETLLAVVSDMLADRTLQQVAQVEARHGLSARTLQRLFARYVGVGPKWVLARYRIHDAVTELDAGYTGPLADLAASLGWYDQAHFVRDFARLVGEPPDSYRRRTRG